jgi:EmrB/QacA subfamily drug resistance transporter
MTQATIRAQATPGDRPAPDDRVPRAVFALTVTGAFIVALDLSIVNVAFPSITQSYPGTMPSALSWVLTAYSVVFGALLLGAGRIADRSGRRRIFLWGLAVFAAGSALCAAAPAVEVLIAGRVVQAVGAALLMPASLALLLAASPPAARPRAVAMWGGIAALAVATGPSVGSVLISAGGWRWAFLINLPVTVGAGLAARHYTRESVVGGPPPDLFGVAMVSVAVAALALGITQGQPWGWTSPAVLASFATAAVLIPLTVHRARRQEAPAVDLRVFESRTATLANAATLAYATGFFAMLLGNVLFLTEVWGFTTLQAGLAITPGPLVVAALSSTTGRLAGRAGYRKVLVPGGLVFAAGTALLATVVSTEPAYLSRWLPISLVIGLGVALSFPVLSAAAVAGLPGDRFGAGGATNQTSRQLGAVLGVALLVAILGTPTDPAEALERFRWIWVMTTVAALASAAISLGHRRIAASAS